MRLSALVDVERLEVRVTLFERGQQAVERRRILARQDREIALAAREHPVDDLVDDGVELRARRDSDVLDEAEVGALVDLDAVEVAVARRDGDLSGRRRLASSSRIACSFSSGEDVGTNLPIAANPACTDVEGITRTLFSAQPAACSAVRTTFELFGKDEDVLRGTASMPRGCRQPTGSSTGPPR